MSQTVYCEQCGEDPAEIVFETAAVCLECALYTMREYIESERPSGFYSVEVRKFKDTDAFYRLRKHSEGSRVL